MDLWLWLIGAAGIGGSLFFAGYWLLFRKIIAQAEEVEGLKHDNRAKNEAIKAVLDTNQIRDRIRNDPAYADVVRLHYSRKDSD